MNVKSRQVTAQTRSAGSANIDNTNNKITSRPSVHTNEDLNQDIEFICGVKLQVQRNSKQRYLIIRKYSPHVSDDTVYFLPEVWHRYSNQIDGTEHV